MKDRSLETKESNHQFVNLYSVALKQENQKFKLIIILTFMKVPVHIWNVHEMHL